MSLTRERPVPEGRRAPTVRAVADYSEAAEVDGASPWQIFRYVTFPLLLPVFGTVAVLVFIYSFNVFGLVWAMGPNKPEFTRKNSKFTGIYSNNPLAERYTMGGKRFGQDRFQGTWPDDLFL